MINRLILKYLITRRPETFVVDIDDVHPSYYSKYMWYLRENNLVGDYGGRPVGGSITYKHINWNTQACADWLVQPAAKDRFFTIGNIRIDSASGLRSITRAGYTPESDLPDPAYPKPTGMTDLEWALTDQREFYDNLRDMARRSSSCTTHRWVSSGVPGGQAWCKVCDCNYSDSLKGDWDGA